MNVRKSFMLVDPRLRGDYGRVSGFTLVELLVVIAILAVLAVVVVLTLNPAGLLQEARDGNRLSDMATLKSAISIYSADNFASGSLGQLNLVYVSVPDPTATSTAGDQCQGLGLSPLPGGYAYHCAASSTYRKTDGTGWLPINFSVTSFGTPLGQLPVDPTNTTSSARFYEYGTNGTSWEISASPESSKYQALSSQFTTGSSIALIPLALGNYYYERAITIGSGASGTLSNFPVLVSSTLVSFEPSSTNASGRIQNLCTAPNGGQEPCDLMFSTSASCATALNFETGKYVSSTGAITDWVSVPSLSAGTVIYACYGSGSVATDQSHPSSTWDSNYLAVYHLPNGSTLSANDSTLNLKNGTINLSPSAVSGEIGGGVSFDGTNGKDITTAVTLPTTNFTYSFWGVSAGGNSWNRPAGAADFSFGTHGSSIIWGVNQLTALFRNNGTSGDIGASVANLSTGWHYITAVMNSSFGSILYCDGVQIASSSGITSITTGGLTFTMGMDPNQYNGAFTGSVDEVRVSNVVRSPSWILTEYNNQSSPSSFYSMGSEVL